MMTPPEVTTPLRRSSCKKKKFFQTEEAWAEKAGVLSIFKFLWFYIILSLLQSSNRPTFCSLVYSPGASVLRMCCTNGFIILGGHGTANLGWPTRAGSPKLPHLKVDQSEAELNVPLFLPFPGLFYISDEMHARTHTPYFLLSHAAAGSLQHPLVPEKQMENGRNP